MTPTEEKALTVYKASAGSGKTFTLSVEYIKLLIKNPMSFRSTLAVTFTNKATEEMKTRILSQLYGIWKQLPKSKDYIEKIKSELGVTEQFMSDRAKIALFNIVHNYSYFRIETIDSFFQSVLRNLARELDLTANLRIELNDRQIESIAVDEMIDELGEKDELLKWILGYIKENIDDDKNWNVIGYIKSFGENIFREFYKTKSKELNTLLHEKGFFEQYTKRIRTIRDEAEEKLKSVARTKQVLCVTHLPQLAAMGDTHLLIAKGERDGRTYTTVTPLDIEGRKRELARIIGGASITETTLKSAEEMLQS